MATPLRPRRPLPRCLNSQRRHLSVTTPLRSSKPALAATHKNLPTYPYGSALWYKQSNFGLYGGLSISSGNNVSKKTETKTRRKWRPNIQMKALYSHALGKFIELKVATRVLRTVDKCGGLDEYLVGEKPGRVKELGMKGWELRYKVMQTEWWKLRTVEKREKLGLDVVRKYIPDTIQDEDGEEKLVAMFGEKLVIEEPTTTEESSTEEFTTIEDTEEPSFKETGTKLKEPPQFLYISARMKRRAAVTETKRRRAANKRAWNIWAHGNVIEPSTSVSASDLSSFITIEEANEVARQARMAEEARLAEILERTGKEAKPVMMPKKEKSAKKRGLPLVLPYSPQVMTPLEARGLILKQRGLVR